jgi:hypothetical protein
MTSAAGGRRYKDVRHVGRTRQTDEIKIVEEATAR